MVERACSPIESNEINCHGMKDSRSRGAGKVELVLALMIIGLLIFLSVSIYNSLKADEANEPPGKEIVPPPTSPKWNSGADAESNGSETPVIVLPRD